MTLIQTSSLHLSVNRTQMFSRINCINITREGIQARVKRECCLQGVHKIFHSYLSPRLNFAASGRAEPYQENVCQDFTMHVIFTGQHVHTTKMTSTCSSESYSSLQTSKRRFWAVSASRARGPGRRQLGKPTPVGQGLLAHVEACRRPE